MARGALKIERVHDELLLTVDALDGGTQLVVCVPIPDGVTGLIEALREEAGLDPAD